MHGPSCCTHAFMDVAQGPFRQHTHTVFRHVDSVMKASFHMFTAMVPGILAPGGCSPYVVARCCWYTTISKALQHRTTDISMP